MMLSSGLTRPMPRAHRLQTFPRLFMECALEQAEALPARSVGSGIAFEAWSDRHQDDAARVIARSYEGHIDSQINDQYRSIAGARRFLLNIVQYPGCGNFFYPASFVAMDLSQGHLCGVCLSSLVAADVGHITQICVTPEAKGAGIGYELLRRSMRALVQAGCREVSSHGDHRQRAGDFSISQRRVHGSPPLRRLRVGGLLSCPDTIPA